MYASLRAHHSKTNIPLRPRFERRKSLRTPRVSHRSSAVERRLWSMTQSRTVLGRGLSALIPTNDKLEEQSHAQAGLVMVPLEQIQPPQNNLEHISMPIN